MLRHKDTQYRNVHCKYCLLYCAGLTITLGRNGIFESDNSLWIAYDFGLGLYFNGNTGSEGVITVASTGLRPNGAETRGLLGTWNDNDTDDFMAKDGTVYDKDSSIEELHQFGISCKFRRK